MVTNIFVELVYIPTNMRIPIKIIRPLNIQTPSGAGRILYAYGAMGDRSGKMVQIHRFNLKTGEREIMHEHKDHTQHNAQITIIK